MSKDNSKGQLCHYLAVKKLSGLLNTIKSKHYGDFSRINCLNSFRTKNKLALHQKICKNKIFCKIVMPSEDTKI